MKTTYKVYHPINGDMNHKCEPAKYEYELITTVIASSLEDAFRKCQNFNSDYDVLGKRSTSIGDIIMMEDNDPALVMNIGFQVVTPKWLSYIDYSSYKNELELNALESTLGQAE